MKELQAAEPSPHAHDAFWTKAGPYVQANDDPPRQWFSMACMHVTGTRRLRRHA